MNNWTKSTSHSIKSSYSFLRKVFESPQIKVVSKLLNKKSDVRVLPFTVRLEYITDIGNIEDSIFQILPGLDKPITSIIYVPSFANNQNYPYRIIIDNPNTATLQVWVDTLKVTRTPKVINKMPFYSEEQAASTEVSALLTAANATNAAIQALTQATQEASQAAIAAENEDLEVLDPQVYSVGTTPLLISPANDSNRGLLINNQANTKVKLFATDGTIAQTTSYASGGHIFDMTTKGVYEVPEAFVQANIYAVSNTANGSVSVTVSRVVAPVLGT